MLTVKLRNVASGEVLDLAEISQNGSGTQAVAGATGFGLPPVEVHWFEGAGDGAVANGYRVQPRDLDIPLHIYAATGREALKTAVAKLSRVVAGRFVLELYEDGELYRTLEVYRVGGGSYTYGQDSIGEDDWQAIITVRAGQPYWLSADASSEPAHEDGDAFTLTNDGTATTKPVWTITGPAERVVINNTTTNRFLEWSGNLAAGDTLTIDTGAATAVDQTGANRYGGFGTAPDLFPLEPGDNDITVELTKPVETVRTNYETNPTFGNTTHGWTPIVVSGSGTPTATVVGGKLRAGDAFSTTLWSAASKTITGLSAHAGETFVARFTLSHTHGLAIPIVFPHAMLLDVAGTITTHALTQESNEQTFAVEFTVPLSGEITLTARQAVTGGGFTAYYATFVDEVYVGPPGDYFDGGTTDTVDMTYAWSGTAHDSTSTATPTADPDPLLASVEWRERDWMVV